MFQLFRNRRRYRRPYGRGHALRPVIKYAIAAFATPFIASAAYLYWVSVTPLSPEPKIYVVQPGTTLRGFAHQLYDEKVLPDAHTLVWLAYLKGQGRDLKAGEYRFRKGVTPMELLDQVVNGRVVEYPFTIVEGWTFKQVMQSLDAAPRLTHTLQGMPPQKIMASLGYPGMSPEGRFYPDTYYYSAGMSDLLVLQRAFQKMDVTLQKEWASRDSSVPLKTPEQALTLASIVEKESSKPEERSIIAGVFANRLRLGMRLQTDPTVIYGMGDRYHGKITFRDLTRPTPYNTYVIHGLPPTPIAMPSEDSLHAALNPADTKALYFVSRGDGTHVFSDNLADHNRAVIKYQLKGKPLPQASAEHLAYAKSKPHHRRQVHRRRTGEANK